MAFSTLTGKAVHTTFVVSEDHMAEQAMCPFCEAVVVGVWGEHGLETSRGCPHLMGFVQGFSGPAANFKGHSCDLSYL